MNNETEKDYADMTQDERTALVAQMGALVVTSGNIRRIFTAATVSAEFFMEISHIYGISPENPDGSPKSVGEILEELRASAPKTR